MAARMALARPVELKALDARREAEPLRFQSEHNLGGVCYVDASQAPSPVCASTWITWVSLGSPTST